MIEAFKEIDKDNDDMIGRDDLQQTLRRFMNKSDTKKYINQLFIALNTNQSGYISYSEFIGACLGTEELFSEINIKAAHLKIDRKIKGYIDEADLWALCEGKEPSQEIIDDMLFSSDIDKDLRITWNDFKRYITNPLK